MELELWSNDKHEMKNLQDEIDTFITTLFLDGTIPLEVAHEARHTSPLTIGNAVRQTILEQLKPSNPKQL